MDNLNKKQRSFCMSQIKSINTKNEIIFRKFLRMKGLNSYRLKHKLLGSPDLFFPTKRIAVFIDG
ncbi:hypothetical protein FJY90_05455 [Candidatus Gottesmanbacteria bacterium]|nr:hypothetical protein [Candidatus Gottesmanbacteria bacterium]